MQGRYRNPNRATSIKKTSAYRNSGIKRTRAGYNSKYRNAAGTAPPSVRNTNKGVIVCHREYIGDILSSDAFVNQQAIVGNGIINPGNPFMFPWLSKVANQFEIYVPRGMN